MSKEDRVHTSELNCMAWESLLSDYLAMCLVMKWKYRLGLLETNRTNAIPSHN